MDYDSLATLASKLTVVGLLATVIALILRGWLVTGREYTNLMMQVSELRAAHAANVSQIEALKTQNAAQQVAITSQQAQISQLSRELEFVTKERDALRKEEQP